MPRPIATCLMLAAALAVRPAAWAQPAPDLPPADPPQRPGPEQAVQDEAPTPPATCAELVEQLAAPDFGARDRATDALLRDNALDAAALRPLLEQAVHPERRRRLLLIAEHHLMRAIIDRWSAEHLPPDQADSAAIGFSYNPLLPDRNPDGKGAGIIILATMPGFPGYAYLKPGDVILAIDGRTTRAGTLAGVRQWVQSAIGGRLDGGRIRLTVQRGEDTRALDVPCGGSTALNEMYLTSGSGNTIRRAGTQRAFQADYAALTEGLPPVEGDATLVPAP